MNIESPTDNNLTKKQLLSEIALLEEKFNTIVNYLQSVETWILPDRSVAFISPGIQEITGYPAEDFIKNPELFSKLIHPDDLPEYNGLYAKINESGIPGEIDRRIVSKSGEIRWIHTRISKVYDDRKNYRGFRTTTIDITKLVAVKNHLQLSESRYKAVVESQTELILRHKRDGTILYVNEAFARFYGINAEVAAGLKWFSLFNREEADVAEHLVSQLSPDNPSTQFEMLVKRSDGEERWISWVLKGIFDKEGALMELLVTGRDITRRKEAEKHLKDALSEIELLKGKLQEENRYLREKFLPIHSNDEIVTDSPLMLQVLEKVRQVALTDAPVLLFGETGTGKEVIANAIHNSSKRRNRVMITVNCAALPPSLIESELFGREKGAYTGALARQIGRFELANHSTIFLDEIGELPLEIQVKLLRVIQFGEFQMLGSPETKKVNVRIIAATNRDLSKAIAEGSFRSDLYYRLNVFPIKVPALRERKEDIPLLSWTFVDEIAAKMGKHIEKISARSMSALLRYSWPGNVRELRNLIEYSIIVAHDTTLVIHIPESEEKKVSGENLDEQQQAHIEKVLNQTGWRIRGEGGAAEKLGLKESTLRFKMKKLGIERKQ